MSFKEASVYELSLNPFAKIGREWMLVTSGNEKNWNTMTASWGFMGVMWSKNVIETVIRPTRYTFEFMEKNDLFTVSFFDEAYRKALQFCGSHSGRDCDKARETGLTPIFSDNTTAFDEASMYFVCRKLYAQDMDMALLAEDCHKWYDKEAVHKAYIGEILKVYVKE